MALNFNPNIYRQEPEKENDADFILKALSTLGDTAQNFGQNRMMRDKMAFDAENAGYARRKDEVSILADQGPEALEYIRGTNRPGKILKDAPPIPSVLPSRKREKEALELENLRLSVEDKRNGKDVSFQKAEYLDGKGRARIGRFNPRTGAIEKNEADAYAPQTARGETAGNLRKEFIDRPETKEFQQINTQVRSMDSLLQRAMAGDLQGRNFLDQSLITIFNKINDPTSVVRESEYARTPEGLALSNRLSGAIAKVAEGGAGLTDQDRMDLVNAAKIIANTRGGTYARTREGYLNLAKQMSLEPELITATMPEYSPYSVGLSSGTPGPKYDPDKERRYQEWKARQGVGQ